MRSEAERASAPATAAATISESAPRPGGRAPLKAPARRGKEITGGGTGASTLASKKGTPRSTPQSSRALNNRQSSTAGKKKRKHRPASQRILQEEHPNLEEEEEEAREEAAALERRAAGQTDPEEIEVGVEHVVPGDTEQHDAAALSGVPSSSLVHEPCGTLLAVVPFMQKGMQLRAEIKRSEDMLEAQRLSFAHRVGTALIEKKARPKELVNEWDKKLKGSVNKIEFRAGVRALGLKASNTDIDSLFDSYDADRGGTLDAPELRDALTSMKEKSLALARSEQEERATLATVQGKLDRIEAAARAVQAVNDARGHANESELAALMESAMVLQGAVLAEEEEDRRVKEEAAAAVERERLERLEREAAEQGQKEAEEAARIEAERQRAEEEATELAPSSTFTLLAEELRAEINSLDPSKQEWKTVRQVLGEVLVKKDLRPKELVATWDQKHKGCVNKIEFLQGLRKGLGLKVDNKEAEKLFDSFDSDGGGTLDAPELKDALKVMQDTAAEALRDEGRRASRQARLRARLGRIEEAVELTCKAERAFEAVEAAKASNADSAEIEAEYVAALALKRKAITAQLALAKAEAEAARIEKEANEAVEREKREVVERDAAARATAAEKAAKRAVKEKLEREEREERLRKKNFASFGMQSTEPLDAGSSGGE